MADTEAGCRRLLIIDDDDALRTALESAVAEFLGWTVLTAPNPEAAAQLYESVDIVMTDWNMPHGGGSRVLAEATRPVLIYSSECASLAHPFRLRKPATLAALEAALLHTLDSAKTTPPKG